MSSSALRSDLESASKATGSFLWHGPSFMNRMGGNMNRIAPKAGEQKMKKVIGLFGLTMMSTAAIIGSGIFVLTGVVAKNYAGPGVVVSYIIAGVVAMLSAMCYMEFAAETRTTGASIVYTCKIFGKLVAWLVAINVLMELIIAAAAVASGFSGYLSSLIKTLDDAGPHRLTDWNGSTLLYRQVGNGPMLTIDLVAAGTVLLITLMLVMGVREAEWLQNICTSLCVVSIIMSIIVGFIFSNKSNWQPFSPFGFDGMFRGASVVFFAYLGFEMMAAAPEESVNPKKHVPLAMGVSVAGCTVLYVLMALVICGMVPYASINEKAPFTTAFRSQGQVWMAIIVGFGSLMGIFDTIIVVQYSMSRTFVMLGRMGLVPPMLSRVHPKTHTPIVSVLFCGILSAVLALFVPIGELADLTSLGALFAFCVVCLAVIFRRYYQPPNTPAHRRGLTGKVGAPLWKVMIPFWSIIGSSLGLAFSWATGCHWGVYIGMGGWWLIATAYMWLFLPVVFYPVKLPTPLFPLWPSLGVLTTIFLIASLGPLNWARWGYGCLVGLALFGLYGLVELFYNWRNGPPPRRSPHICDEDSDDEEDVAAEAAEAGLPHGHKETSYKEADLAAGTADAASRSAASHNGTVTVATGPKDAEK